MLSRDCRVFFFSVECLELRLEFEEDAMAYMKEDE